jgi:hypothetical protein
LRQPFLRQSVFSIKILRISWFFRFLTSSCRTSRHNCKRSRRGGFCRFRRDQSLKSFVKFNNIPDYVTPDEEVCFRGRNYCQGFQSTYDTVNERTNTNKRHKEVDNFFYPQAFSFSSHHKIASTFILTDKPTTRKAYVCFLSVFIFLCFIPFLSFF